MILVVYIRVNSFSPSLVYLLDLVMRPSFMKVELRHTSQYATVYVDGVVPHSASKKYSRSESLDKMWPPKWHRLERMVSQPASDGCLAYLWSQIGPRERGGMFQCLLRMLGPSTRTRTILIVAVATYSYPEVFCLLVFATLRYVLYYSLTIGRLFASSLLSKFMQI